MTSPTKTVIERRNTPQGAGYEAVFRGTPKQVRFFADDQYCSQDGALSEARMWAAEREEGDTSAALTANEALRLMLMDVENLEFSEFHQADMVRMAQSNPESFIYALKVLRKVSRFGEMLEPLVRETLKLRQSAPKPAAAPFRTSAAAETDQTRPAASAPDNVRPIKALSPTKETHPEDQFPWDGQFSSPEQVTQYLSGPKLTCLLCGKQYSSLGRHLRVHKISAEKYNKQFGLPEGTVLCSNELSELRSLAAHLAQDARRANSAGKPAATAAPANK